MDYLVHSAAVAPRVHHLVTEWVTGDEASDEILYNIKIPGSILEGGRKLPRANPRVEEVFRRRRALAERARCE